MKDSVNTANHQAANFTAPPADAGAKLSDNEETMQDLEKFGTYSKFFDNDEEIIGDYPADSWSYEVPRPWLTIEEAAGMLGRSARGVERSILGRWGNHLPEGWSARRVRIDGVDEWRIVPPPGFRIKHNRSSQVNTEASDENENIADVVASPVSPPENDPALNERKNKEEQPDKPFSLEKFLHSAGRIAQKELASFGLTVRAAGEKAIVDADVERTIVIDRSDEVEKLLRELSSTQKELAEQRRMHLEDLRQMHEMQSSLLLLEVRARETSELKQDLTAAQIALKEHRHQYQEFLALPWYKRLFRKLP